MKNIYKLDSTLFGFKQVYCIIIVLIERIFYKKIFVESIIETDKRNNSGITVCRKSDT